MSKHETFRLLLLILVVALLVTSSHGEGEANGTLKAVANHTYEIADGKCQLLAADGGRAIVDLTRLVVHMKGNEYLENYDLTSLGLPEIPLATGRFADGFYVLKLPDELDPFEAAEALGNSGDFEFVRFDILYPLFGHAAPNDSLYADEQWNLRKIGLPDGWEFWSCPASVDC